MSVESAAATFRYATTSNRIYIEGGGSATLTDIKAALPRAPLDLLDPAAGVWLLRANLLVADGSVLVLHGTSIGGDVNEFRLQSNNDSAPGSFVSVTADWGTLDIASTRITSWDLAAGGPDTEFQTFGRAFMRARSSLDADGVTARESRMDIVDSDVGFLGYDASESYGLALKVNGVSPDPSKTIFDLVNVFGDIRNSRIHDNYFGIYTFGALGCQWLNNEVDHNAGYGFDPHDDSDNLLIDGNNVHHNGFGGRGHHGIIASRRCDHVTIRNNRSWANAGNGIMLHRHSSDALVENNQTFQNGDSGIAVFDSDRIAIRNNLVVSNFNAGMRFSVGASDCVVEQNEVGYSGKYGFYIYEGSDIPEPDDTDPVVSGRPRRNRFSNNLVHDSISQPVNLSSADDSQFLGNTFTPGPSALGFENATNSLLAGNTFPANMIVRLDGNPTNHTTMTLKDQPLVPLQIDGFSTAVFTSDLGAIFDPGDSRLATAAGPAGSSLTLTLAALHVKTLTATLTVLTRDFLVAPNAGTVLVRIKLWNTSGAFQKDWLVHQGATLAPQAAAVTATIHYVVGDLAAGAGYLVNKNGHPLLAAVADASGHIDFTDVPGAEHDLEYTVNPVGATPPPPPTVTVVAAESNAAEQDLKPGSFRVRRADNLYSALTVNYTLGGTAVNGVDYQPLPGSVTLPAGSASALVMVIPIDDTEVEGKETVGLTLSPDPAYLVGSPAAATVVIADNDKPPPPVVSLGAVDLVAAEPGTEIATLTVSRTGTTANSLKVRYSLSGTARNGLDYKKLSGTVNIPIGALSANVVVTPKDDLLVEGPEDVIVTLSPDPAYQVGLPNTLTVTILDNDL